MVRVLLGAALASSLLSSGVKQDQELSFWKTRPVPFRYLFFGSKVQTRDYWQKNFDTKNLETPVYIENSSCQVHNNCWFLSFWLRTPQLRASVASSAFLSTGAFPPVRISSTTTKQTWSVRKNQGDILKHIFNSRLEVSSMFNCSCQRHLLHNIRWQSHTFLGSWVKIDFWVL